MTAPNKKLRAILDEILDLAWTAGYWAATASQDDVEDSVKASQTKEALALLEREVREARKDQVMQDYFAMSGTFDIDERELITWRDNQLDEVDRKMEKPHE